GFAEEYRKPGGERFTSGGNPARALRRTRNPVRKLRITEIDVKCKDSSSARRIRYLQSSA
ncbi:MAG: hypothetical protein K1X51_16660, partial [Rhodospirillaceae bacterium]|nr:hypothetical protein [Rhodospirillaceae bacterium]